MNVCVVLPFRGFAHIAHSPSLCNHHTCNHHTDTTAWNAISDLRTKTDSRVAAVEQLREGAFSQGIVPAKPQDRKMGASNQAKETVKEKPKEQKTKNIATRRKSFGK